MNHYKGPKSRFTKPFLSTFLWCRYHEKRTIMESLWKVQRPEIEPLLYGMSSWIFRLHNLNSESVAGWKAMRLPDSSILIKSHISEGGISWNREYSADIFKLVFWIIVCTYWFTCWKIWNKEHKIIKLMTFLLIVCYLGPFSYTKWHLL